SADAGVRGTSSLSGGVGVRGEASTSNGIGGRFQSFDANGKIISGFAGPGDGTEVLTALANGNVGIGVSGGLSRLTVKGRNAFLGTGTVSVTNGSTTVTGSGTQFLTDVAVGDRIQVG